jgi:hypothetical protein
LVMSQNRVIAKIRRRIRRMGHLNQMSRRLGQLIARKKEILVHGATKKSKLNSRTGEWHSPSGSGSMGQPDRLDQLNIHPIELSARSDRRRILNRIILGHRRPIC